MDATQKIYDMICTVAFNLAIVGLLVLAGLL